MAEKKYSIITNGRPIKGSAPDEVLKNLAALFKATPDKVRPLLAGKVITIRKGLDETTTRRMLAALKKAGLTCKAEPERPVTATQGAQPPRLRVGDAAKLSVPDVRAAMKARTIDPEMGSIAIEHTALPAGEITSSALGLDFHKPGATDVPFDNVLFMAVYDVPSTQGPDIMLMVFISGAKRPFVVKTSSIKYWQFKGISSQSAALSLRQFIAHVYARNNSLMLDKPTVEYLDGALPRSQKLDESILASAFGKELAAKGLFVETIAPMPASGTDMTGVFNTLKVASAKEPSLVAQNRARLAIASTALSVGYIIWALMGQLRLLGSYSAYFSSGNHSVVNHLLMWTSLSTLIMLATSALVVIHRIHKQSERAQGAVLMYSLAFGIVSLVHFFLLAGIGLGVRRGILRGGFALFSLPDVLKSKHLILNSLLISPAGVAIPVAFIVVSLFSRSWEVKSRFRG